MRLRPSKWRHLPGLNALVLDPNNRFVCRFTGKIGVATTAHNHEHPKIRPASYSQAFPVTPSSSDASKVHHWPERDMHPLAFELFPHRLPALPNKISVPSTQPEINNKTRMSEKMATHVEAALIPAGNAVTRSAKRTPNGLSSKQSPGHPTSGIAPMFPTHLPTSHPTPVVILTF